MEPLYTVHFFGGPKHRESMVTKLTPEIRFPVMEDIKMTTRSEGLETVPTLTRYHVYERQIGTVDYIYRGLE
jgi:hypothetical protein